jgi:hypothetical protein
VRKSLEAIKRAYLQELKTYWNWTEQMKAFYGQNLPPMFSWEASDWRKIEAWNEALTKIEFILGLTKKEVQHLEELAKKGSKNDDPKQSRI